MNNRRILGFLRHHVCPFDCTNIPYTYYELNFPEQP